AVQSVAAGGGFRVTPGAWACAAAASPKLKIASRIGSTREPDRTVLIALTFLPEVCDHPAWCSSTVNANRAVPTKPTAPAIRNGNGGVISQSIPPAIAAGVLARLRMR